MSDTPRTDALLRRLHDEVVRNNKDRVPMQAPFEQAIDLCLELEREHSKSGTEAVARWMISHGYTTGHGDDLDDLLAELVRQVMEPHKPDSSSRGVSDTSAPIRSERTETDSRAGAANIAHPVQCSECGDTRRVVYGRTWQTAMIRECPFCQLPSEECSNER